MAVTYGVDASPAYQAGLDVAALPKAGISFFICKITEGVSWYRTAYHTFSAEAKAAGLLFSAYHFLRAEYSGEAQAAHVRRSMGPDWGLVPVMLDWETSVANTWADASHAIAFVNEIRRLGGRIHLNYLPHWYWDRIDRPDLSKGTLGSLALIQSNYVSGIGLPTILYPGDFSSRWAGFGGRNVSILQYSSRCRIPGYGGDLDINAYRGTREQLAATGWFYDPLPKQEVDEMALGDKITAAMIGQDVVNQYHEVDSDWSDMTAARAIALAGLRGLQAEKTARAALAAAQAAGKIEIDYDKLGAAIVSRLPAGVTHPTPQDIATAVADEQYRRQAG